MGLTNKKYSVQYLARTQLVAKVKVLKISLMFNCFIFNFVGYV